MCGTVTVAEQATGQTHLDNKGDSLQVQSHKRVQCGKNFV